MLNQIEKNERVCVNFTLYGMWKLAYLFWLPHLFHFVVVLKCSCQMKLIYRQTWLGMEMNKRQPDNNDLKIVRRRYLTKWNVKQSACFSANSIELRNELGMKKRREKISSTKLMLYYYYFTSNFRCKVNIQMAFTCVNWPRTNSK